MKTYLYTLSVKDVEHEVAHLFEHLLLRKLNAILLDANIITPLEVAVKGETFADYIFIQFKTSNKQAAELFESFMMGRNKIDLNDVDIELQRIEIEEKTLLTIPDRDAVMSLLKQLSSTSTWENVLTSNHKTQFVTHNPLADDSRLIQKRKSARSFRDLSAGFGARDLSADELALFNILSPIILDTIYNKFNKAGLYIYGNSAPHRLYEKEQPLPHGIDYMIFGVKRNTLSNAEIQTLMNDSFNTFASDYDLSKVRARIKNIVDDPNFIVRTLDYLGIYTSPARTESLVTKENIDSLLAKINTLVRPTNNGDWDRV